MIINKPLCTSVFRHLGPWLVAKLGIFEGENGRCAQL